MKRLQKAIIAFLHIFLLLACLCIVLFMRHLTEKNNPKMPATPSQALEKTKETEAETTQEAESGQKAKEQPEITEKISEKPTPEKPYDSTEAVPDLPPTLMLASDLHYMSSDTHDDDIAFQYFLETDDGKISQHSDEIIDALLEEALQTKPSALLLTGDITLNGELENHRKLSEKLQTLQDAGVPVLVIPGNHDINNQNAATYFGTERKETDYLKSREEFYEIYQEFGYNQALSQDEHSLSYLYELDETHWLLLLDSCQYEDYNHVNGKIRQETLTWMETQLKLAADQEVQVITAAHHNLLSESRLYTADCTLENHLDVIELLERYEVPLYLSGHLHAQRIKKHLSEPGIDPDSCSISEIVLSPYSLPPCQYGMLTWDENNEMKFETKTAAFDFTKNLSEFSKTIIRNQVKKTISGVPDDLKEQMANLYAEIYYDYCAGNQMSWNEIKDTRAYRLWERVAPDSIYVKEMWQMVKDVREAHHEWEWTDVS